MARLLLFNPDTDYAMCSPGLNYTPPRHVVELRRRLALMPALYADPGDTILLLDEPSLPLEQLEHHDTAKAKAIEIVTLRKASSQRERHCSLTPDPWGWNNCLRHMLKTRIGDMPGLPSEEEMNKLKALSHRRTTVKFLEEMRDALSDEIEMPREITDVREALEAYRRDPRIFFKAPWSSSGRGIMLTDDLEERHVAPWVGGIIESQGSVMMEKAYRRKLDFATEWMVRDSKAEFLGYSVFSVSRRGKYHGNVSDTQRNLQKLIEESTAEWNDGLLERQREALEKIVAKDYSGPLGIDMLVTESGAVNPCVEINLRRTMGMLPLIETQP